MDEAAATTVCSTTVSIHAAANSSTPLGGEDSVRQMSDYHSIERGAEEQNSENEHTADSRDKTCCKHIKCYRQKGTLGEHLVYFCALAVASYVGVVARIYLSKLAEWNGVPFFPSIYSEVVGTAIMGFISSHKKLLQVRHKAVYQAIATGLCGSITTFSSWNFEAVTILLQIDQDTVNNVTRVIGWLTVILLGLGMPFAALHFGKHVACLSPWNDQRLPDQTSDNSQPTRRCIAIEGFAFVIIWMLFTTIGIVIPYHFKRLDLLFSIVFSAFGTYVRWHLSPLNSAFTNFKSGTFIVNVLGTWVLGAAAVSQRYLKTSRESDDVVLQVLIALVTGFCGCLTTVSTFAVELTSLPLLGTYIYAFSSILLAQVGLIIIRGTYEWVYIA